MTDRDVTHETVVRFAQQMSAEEPGPAAGAAAGVAVGMAAALAGKMARLSHSRLDDAEVMWSRADTLRARALHLAQADTETVIAVLSGEGDAAPDAIEVPRKIGDLATQVQHLASYLAEHGNPRLSADATAAHHLATAASAIIEAIVASNTSAGG